MTQNFKSLKKLLKGIAEVSEEITVTGVTNDSRAVKSGDLFIAVLGDTVDARQFIPSAIEKGAAAIVFESKDGYELSESAPIAAFPVASLDESQGVIASRFFDIPSKKMRCVGVTGTNGKTSITQWVAQALSQCKITCGVIGTLGFGFPQELNKTGYTTPDPIVLQKSLDDLYERGAKAVALEVSSHALSQHRLKGVHFDVAVFTQLSRDHLDYHGNMDNYAAAKKLLFQEKDLNAAVINVDDSYGAQWAEHFSKDYPVITYSLHDKSALIQADRIQPMSDGFLIDVKTPWGEGAFRVPFLGEFNISNVLAVLGVLGHFDIPLKHALNLLELLEAVPGRMEMLGGDGLPAVVIDYAHTPDALKNALESLRPHCQGQMWCVFGCGGDRDQGKRPEMAKVAELYSDHIIVTNDNPRTESPQRIVNDIMTGFSRGKVMVETDRAKAIASAVKMANPKDTILIAGKGHEDIQIIGEETLPFSDLREAKQALARRGD